MVWWASHVIWALGESQRGAAGTGVLQKPTSGRWDPRVLMIRLRRHKVRYLRYLVRLGILTLGNILGAVHAVPSLRQGVQAGSVNFESLKFAQPVFSGNLVVGEAR